MKKLKKFEPILLGLSASFIIGVLAFLSFETSTGLWVMFSFGSTTLIVLIFYRSEFAQPGNIFFGHILGILIGILFNEIFGASGNALDYYSVKATSAVDFRADNDTNFQSLEKNSIDLYSSFKSIYLQNRENKIKNSIQNEDEWGNLDN